MIKLVSWNIDRLDELVDLWNRELSEDFPMRKTLFEQNSFQDRNVCFEASRIAVDSDNHVVGFIVAKRWQETHEVDMNAETGWIQVLLVDHAYRRHGIGSRLFEHAETVLKAAGIKEMIFGADPWHYFPGVPSQYNHSADWVEQKGFKHIVTAHDFLCEYTGSEAMTIPDMEGVVFRLLDESEKDEFLDFMHRCFPGRWEYEAMMYFEKGGTGREFVILKKNGRMIGFCRINDADSPFIAQNVYWAPLFEDSLGGLGPLGIDEKERKQGYGLAIVQAGIAHLRQRGIKKIVIDWTVLVDFYKKLGYDNWKSYDVYKKIF